MFSIGHCVGHLAQEATLTLNSLFVLFHIFFPNYWDHLSENDSKVLRADLVQAWYQAEQSNLAVVQ
jgi:hypothetical protein